MTNQTGAEPEEAFRNRNAEDEDLSVEGHAFKVGRATGEPGPDDIRPRASGEPGPDDLRPRAADDDLDVEGHRIRP